MKLNLDLTPEQVEQALAEGRQMRLDLERKIRIANMPPPCHVSVKEMRQATLEAREVRKSLKKLMDGMEHLTPEDLAIRITSERLTAAIEGDKNDSLQKKKP